MFAQPTSPDLYVFLDLDRSAMLRHGWLSFFWLHPCPTTDRGEESPPASRQFNSIRDIPTPPPTRAPTPPTTTTSTRFPSRPVWPRSRTTTARRRARRSSRRRSTRAFSWPGLVANWAVTVRWGRYAPADIEEADGSKTSVWLRSPHEAALSIQLGGSAGPVVRDVPGSEGLQLHVAERPHDTVGESGAELPAGTRSVSCILVNRCAPDEAQPDRTYAFQAEIEVRTDEGFVPRPDLRGAQAGEWDDRVADLHYADTREYATGHGVSAEWEFVDDGCRSIRTVWIGTAEVEKTSTADVPAVELSMEALHRLDDGDAVQQALGPLVAQYRDGSRPAGRRWPPVGGRATGGIRRAVAPLRGGSRRACGHRVGGGDLPGESANGRPRPRPPTARR